MPGGFSGGLLDGITELLEHYLAQVRCDYRRFLYPSYNCMYKSNQFKRLPAPRLWNSLTDDIRSIQNLGVFKNKIKTLLFREAY